MNTDWDKCSLCQRVTTEALQCPAKSKRLDIGVGQGYSTLYANIKRFSELCELPMPVDLDRLDEGNGIEATFLNNKAMWHKSCYNKFNTTKLRAERRKCSIEDNEAETTPARKYTRKSARHEDKMVQDICFFCAEGASTPDPLREVATKCLDYSVRKCAHDLQDEYLLAKLSVADIIALEAKYHPQCLVSLYYKAAALKMKALKMKDKHDKSDVNHGIALAELSAYIEDARMEDIAPIFELSDLVKLYSSRLEYLGMEQHTHPHSTVLKNRILAKIPELKASKEGRDILLTFDDDLGPALRRACDDDCDSEAMCCGQDCTKRHTGFANKIYWLI